MLNLGPLALPWGLLLLGLAWGAAGVLGGWLGRRAGVAVDAPLGGALLAGLLAARLGFVADQAAWFAQAPLQALDVRDGGWHLGAGLLGAAAWAAWRVRRTPALRRPLAASLGLGGLLLGGGLALLEARGPAPRALPDLAVQALDGRPEALALGDGRPLVLNLWASWCPPCVREMPALVAAPARHPGWRFVLLNQGEPPAAVAAWLRARGLDPQAVRLDPSSAVGQALGQKVFPTTLFFDAEGRLLDERAGELSAASLAARLEALR